MSNFVVRQMKHSMGACAVLAALVGVAPSAWAQPRPVPPTPVAAVAQPSTDLRSAEGVRGAVPARPGQRRRALPAIGLSADVGVPEGMIAALNVRPVSWLRLHAGGGTNTASPGVRGGVTFIPLGVGPSLTLEGGHVFPGDVNEIVRTFFFVRPSLEPLFQRMSYSYGNAHLGLEIGKKWFTFFLRGGVSYTRATLLDAEEALQAQASTTRTTVTLHRDPILRAVTPSAKLGFVVYLQ